MANDYEELIINKSTLIAIADAIRSKTGDTAEILVKNIPDKIAEMADTYAAAYINEAIGGDY